jgi:hypothetical protein
MTTIASSAALITIAAPPSWAYVGGAFLSRGTFLRDRPRRHFNYFPRVTLPVAASTEYTLTRPFGANTRN